MEEPYTEGVAIHGDPESCVGDPRGRSEAFTGARAGRAIEPRNQLDRGADAVTQGGRPCRRQRYSRVVGGPRAVEEPVHARNLHAREPGDPMPALPPVKVRAARGRPRPHARDARSWEVGSPRSTCEAAEQGCVSGRGGGGGKGATRGERGQQNVPRTQRRARHAECAGSRTPTWAFARVDVRPERGAQCGSSACWDLCGGPPERAVPTATSTRISATFSPALAVRPRTLPRGRTSRCPCGRAGVVMRFSSLRLPGSRTGWGRWARRRVSRAAIGGRRPGRGLRGRSRRRNAGSASVSAGGCAWRYCGCAFSRRPRSRLCGPRW